VAVIEAHESFQGSRAVQAPYVIVLNPLAGLVAGVLAVDHEQPQSPGEPKP
jgi:hypothetical protein